MITNYLPMIMLFLSGAVTLAGLQLSYRVYLDRKSQREALDSQARNMLKVKEDEWKGRVMTTLGLTYDMVQSLHDMFNKAKESKEKSDD